MPLIRSHMLKLTEQEAILLLSALYAVSPDEDSASLRLLDKVEQATGLNHDGDIAAGLTSNVMNRVACSGDDVVY